MKKISFDFNDFMRGGHDDDCLRELVQEHYAKIYLTTGFSAFGLAMVSYISWIVATDSQQPLLVVWLCSWIALAVFRLFNVRRYQLHQIEIDNRDELLEPSPWAKLELLACGCFGALVGVLFFIMYEGDFLASFNSVQAATVTIAVTFAVSGFLAIYLPCYVAFCAASAVPIVIKLLLFFDLPGILGLLFFVGFHWMLYHFISALSRKLAEPIELRLQNMDLIENLARRNDALEEQNRQLLLALSQKSD